MNEIKNDKKREGARGGTRSEKTGQRLTSNEKQTRVASLSLPVLAAFHRLTTYFSPSRNVSHSSPTILQTPRTHFFPPPNAITASNVTQKLLYASEKLRSRVLRLSIITGPTARSISGYFKLLSRCAVPRGPDKTSPNVSLGKFRTADRKLIRRCWADRGQRQL